ncbi:hypothetical protein MMC11_007599 [Xylographa trunciseda]|nr:hypothetical protein [Xylographa trunciseda]
MNQSFEEQSKAHLLALGALAQRAGIDQHGFSIKRWLFWRRRLQELSHNADTAVAEKSNKGFMSMISCGRNLDYDVPGEAKIAEKLQAAMGEALAKSGKESFMKFEMVNDASKSTRTSLEDVQRAIRSRKNSGSVRHSGGSEGQAEHAATKFFSPENRDFPYKLVYTPLSGERNTLKQKLFRLAHILPGSGEDPIKCELFVNKFDSRVPYEALSYCAGDPSDCCRILLNGFPFKTFHSTFDAIKRFRDCKETTVMWIDQLCINQTDIEERDSQVLLMSDIYKHAAPTQIWLGEAAEDPPSSLAFDLLNGYLTENRADLHEYIMEVGTAQPGYHRTGDPLRDYLHAQHGWYKCYFAAAFLRNEEGRQHLTPQKVVQWFHAACNDPLRLKSWHALFQLFNQPWWSRCWIIQEAVVSRESVVNCGLNLIVWDDLCSFLDSWHICHQIWNRSAFQDVNLENLMRSCFRAQLSRENFTSDPRDKIYSVLGMLTDENRQAYAIVPNYAPSHTIAEVYIATAIAILKVESNPRLLINISGRELENGLPTWVPDWSQPQVWNWGEIYTFFKAGIGYPAQVEVLENRLELKLHGSFVDTVEVIGPVDSVNESGVLIAWENLFVHRLQDKDDLHLLDSFYRTLNLNWWSMDTGDPHGDPKEFKRVWNEALELSRTNPERVSLGSRFYISRGNAPGMAPLNAQEGDIIFIPWGSRVPFVVRRLNAQGDRHQLIGACYLQGMMHGEVFKLKEEGRVTSEDIYLV